MLNKNHLINLKQKKDIKSQKIELDELTIKAESKMNDFNAITKDYNERSEIIKNNYDRANVILAKQADEIKNRTEKLSDLTSKVESKNIEIKYKTKKIEILAEEISSVGLELNNLRETEKVVREDLNRTVNDFNAQDKQVLNRAVAFIKTLPNQFQESWSRFNVERKRTPSAWAKKLANEKKNGLER